MSDLILSAAMDSFLAEEDPANVFLPLAGGTMDSGADINFANGSRLREGLTDAGNGGAGGIAMVCSLDYEFKWEAGRLYVMEQDGFTIRVEQFGFTFAPTATDDETKGYVVGSRRILDNGTVYLCTDATTNTAVWVRDDLILSDSSDVISVDAGNRQLISADGATLMLDWSNPYRTNIPAGVSLGVNTIFDADIPQRYIDVENGVLGDYSGSYYPSIDWQNRYLYDSSGNFITAYWGLCELWDITTGFKSLDWNARQLFASDGLSVMMEWPNPMEAVIFPYGVRSSEEVTSGATYGFSSTDGSSAYFPVGIRLSGDGSANIQDVSHIETYNLEVSNALYSQAFFGGDLVTPTTAYIPYGVNLDNTYSINWPSVGTQAYVAAWDAGGGSYIGMGNVDFISLNAVVNANYGVTIPYPNSLSTYDIDNTMGTIAISVDGRQLIASDGLTAVLDWSYPYQIDIPIGISLGVNTIFDAGIPTRYIDVENGVLGDYSSSYYPSINWANRQLIGSDGATVSVVWENRYLADTIGYSSVDWANRLLMDTSGIQASADWANRRLIASDGTTVAADWSTGTPAFAQGASYTPTAYASLPATPAEGTVCYVNDADSPFSLGSVVTSGGTGKILACFDGTDWRIIAHFA